MRVHTINSFLTAGAGALPQGHWTAAGIHPSSEVDLVDIDGQRLSPCSIVPIDGLPQVRAVRNAPVDTGASTAGQTLVLQLYERCDPLVPPGPRAPIFRSARIAAGSVGAAAEAASLAFRLPFAGRRQAMFSFLRTENTADLSLLIIGAKWGFRDAGALHTVWGHLREQTAETWWNGGGVAPTMTVSSPFASALQARVVYIGGYGDSVEAFDELWAFVYGPAGAAAEVCGEASGER